MRDAAYNGNYVKAQNHSRAGGNESLKQALQQNIGATILFSSRLDEVSQQHPEVSRLKVVMGHLSKVVTKASEIATIAEPLEPHIALLLGSDEPPQ